MSRNDEFAAGGQSKLNRGDLSFRYEPEMFSHKVHASLGDEPVGHIEWGKKSGVIRKVDVSPQFRRQGVATHLLDEARDVAASTRGVKPPKHSDDRTNEGDAWARSLGERLPRRKLE